MKFRRERLAGYRSVKPMCLCGAREEKVSAYIWDRKCTGLVFKVRIEAAAVGRGLHSSCAEAILWFCLLPWAQSSAYPKSAGEPLKELGRGLIRSEVDFRPLWSQRREWTNRVCVCVCVKSLQGRGSWVMESDQSKPALGLGRTESQESGGAADMEAICPKIPSYSAETGLSVPFRSSTVRWGPPTSGSFVYWFKCSSHPSLLHSFSVPSFLPSFFLSPHNSLVLLYHSHFSTRWTLNFIQFKPMHNRK